MRTKSNLFPTPQFPPLIEGFIGTIRYEFIDHTPFWSTLDLERKVDDFREYYNNLRMHALLSGQSPTRFSPLSEQSLANINDYVWILL